MKLVCSCGFKRWLLVKDAGKEYVTCDQCAATVHNSEHQRLSELVHQWVKNARFYQIGTALLHSMQHAGMTVEEFRAAVDAACLFAAEIEEAEKRASARKANLVGFGFATSVCPKGQACTCPIDDLIRFGCRCKGV